MSHAVWACGLLSLPLLMAVASARGAEVAIDPVGASWLWAGGAVLSTVGPLAGLVSLARISAPSAPDPELPDVRWVAGPIGPLTWGFLRPIILLPDTVRDWAPEDRAAALAHERAHIARGDWLMHVLHEHGLGIRPVGGGLLQESTGRPALLSPGPGLALPRGGQRGHPGCERALDDDPGQSSSSSASWPATSESQSGAWT